MALDTDRQKILVSITIFFSCAAVGLIVASFATDNWIKASAIKPNTTTGNNSSSNNDGTTKFTANITFGLFRGNVFINYGFGRRTQQLNVYCKASTGFCFLNNKTYVHPEQKLDALVYKYNNQNTTVRNEAYEYGLFSFGLWVSTLVMAALGIVWGLIYVAFAFFNLLAKPIETITGPLGLYLWNGLAFLFALLAMVLYLVLYFGHYKNNVLTAEDLARGFTSQDRAYLDFSFYFTVGATAAYLLNFGLLCLSGSRMSCSFTREAEKVMDNGIILY